MQTIDSFILDKELLINALPKVADQIALRLEFVGAKTSLERLKRVGFSNTYKNTRWETVISNKHNEKVQIELQLANNSEIYEILCFKDKEKSHSNADIYYDGFKEILQSMLQDAVLALPPDDIAEEFFLLSDSYTVDEIFDTNWSKVWKFDNPEIPAVTTFRNHSLIPLDETLHRMAFIINHSIIANIMPNSKGNSDEFLVYSFLPVPSSRLLTAVFRHLDKHPCRDCLFELLFAIALYEEFPVAEKAYLLNHVLNFSDFSHEELFTMAFTFGMLEQHEAAIECYYAALLIDKDHSCSINNLCAEAKELFNQYKERNIPTEIQKLKTRLKARYQIQDQENDGIKFQQTEWRSKYNG